MKSTLHGGGAWWCWNQWNFWNEQRVATTNANSSSVNENVKKNHFWTPESICTPSFVLFRMWVLTNCFQWLCGTERGIGNLWFVYYVVGYGVWLWNFKSVFVKKKISAMPGQQVHSLCSIWTPALVSRQCFQVFIYFST